MLTETEKSSSQTTAELWSTPSAEAPQSLALQLLENFRGSKEYRHAFVEEKVRTHVAAQIRAIREQRGISRPELARMMGKAPSWVFRLEDPNQPPPTIPTLLQVAEAYDVDLHVNFGPFSTMLRRLETLVSDDLEVPSFDEEFTNSAPRADANLAYVATYRSQGAMSMYILALPKKAVTTEASAEATMAHGQLKLELAEANNKLRFIMPNCEVSRGEDGETQRHA
jgi:transcriptional regulator with XRE-family HTH domain